MKKRFLACTLLFALFISGSKLHAQSIGINSTGALPDSSAALDISSTSKGLLIPRMTTTQRNAIVSPATGLIIFNTTTGSLDVYQSSSWKQLPFSLGTMSLADSSTYQGNTNINKVGTITSGTWNGSTISISRGGTGQTTANGALNALLPSQSGNSGKVLKTDGTNASWQDDKTPSSTSSDQNITTTAWTSITGLSFTATAGTLYRFRATILFTANSGNDYVDFGISGPASPSILSGIVSITKSSTDFERGSIQAYDDGATSAGCLAGLNTATIEGFINTTTTGTVNIRIKARNSNRNTIKSGSYLEIW